MITKISNVKEILQNISESYLHIYTCKYLHQKPDSKSYTYPKGKQNHVSNQKDLNN